jgi:carbon storage regulator
MLVLLRRKDESIIIGDNVEVTVIDVRGEKVWLGIDAPKSISVHRKEVYEAIQREKAEKAKQMPAPPPPLISSPAEDATGSSGDAGKGQRYFGDAEKV